MADIGKRVALILAFGMTTSLCTFAQSNWRELRHDRHEIHRDHAELRHDYRQLRRDEWQHNWAAVQRDRAEIRHDRGDLYHDFTDARRDRREYIRDHNDGWWRRDGHRYWSN